MENRASKKKSNLLKLCSSKDEICYAKIIRSSTFTQTVEEKQIFFFHFWAQAFENAEKWKRKCNCGFSRLYGYMHEWKWWKNSSDSLQLAVGKIMIKCYWELKSEKILEIEKTNSILTQNIVVRPENFASRLLRVLSFRIYLRTSDIIYSNIIRMKTYR